VHTEVAFEKLGDGAMMAFFMLRIKMVVPLTKMLIIVVILEV
jgi:hypothetical protein